MGYAINKPTTARVVKGVFLYVDSPANKFIEALEDVQDADKENCERGVMLASLALRHDPGCIEALVYLADFAKTVDYAIERLKKAVASGDYLWGPIAAEEGEEMTWWGFSATRPYMRAIKALGDAHLEAGDAASARECYERLMAMNPHDNQGIRFALAELDAASTGPTPRR